jgi:hypothetical protein
MTFGRPCRMAEHGHKRQGMVQGACSRWWCSCALLAIQSMMSITIWIGRLIAGSVLAIGLGAVAGAAAHADATAYSEHCARCHAQAIVVARTLKGDAETEKASRLDAFLRSHYAEDAEDRAKIVDYLIGLSRR